MSEQDTLALIHKFEAVARLYCKQRGMAGEWEEFYIEMCCAFIRKNAALEGRPACYIVKACRNEAINEFHKGTSICSKPRKSTQIVSIEAVPDLLYAEVDFVKNIHDKILVEKILARLTERERQIAQLFMEGYSEREISESLRISQPRVNKLKHRIRRKARALLNRGL